MKLVYRISAGVVLVALLFFAALQIWFVWRVDPVEPFAPTKAEQEQLAFYSKPESWFVAHLMGSRETVDGQMLDPKLQYMLEQNRPHQPWLMRSFPLIFSTLWGRTYIRNNIDRQWLLFTKMTAPMEGVEDRTINGRAGSIPIRIYRPRKEEKGPLPVLVYFHGGGWIFSSIVAMDRVSRLIANVAQVIVVSVNYRLAPEHTYPAASDDGEDAFFWALANAAAFGGDAARVGVGGDSAGGHVAINVAQRQVKSHAIRPTAMLLFYPGAGWPQNDNSYKLYGKGYALDSGFIEFILPRVFKDYSSNRIGEADDLMNPVEAKNLEGLPPAIIATAGFDILRDSGRRFAERLKAAGVPVSFTNYPSLTHSFLQFSGVVNDADAASTESARLFGALIRNNADAEAIVSRAADGLTSGRGHDHE